MATVALKPCEAPCGREVTTSSPHVAIARMHVSSVIYAQVLAPQRHDHFLTQHLTVRTVSLVLVCPGRDLSP